MCINIKKPKAKIKATFHLMKFYLGQCQWWCFDAIGKAVALLPWFPFQAPSWLSFHFTHLFLSIPFVSLRTSCPPGPGGNRDGHRHMDKCP